MPPAAPILVESLSKSYPSKSGFTRFPALTNLSFSLQAGEILGFLGPNGAGKTTAIKCILGLLKPTSGRISVTGHRPGSAGARAGLGYVPENPDYDDSLSPSELLRLLAAMRGFDSSERATESLLARVGLAGWEHTRMKRFSKGMKQRAALAAALIGAPSLLIMDEPTGGLDPAARKEFRDIILEENARGAAILLSSHILSEVEAVCGRAVILARGRLVREGSMNSLLSVEDTYRIRASCSGSLLEEDVPSAALQSRIDSLRASGCEIVEIARNYATLEEVFLAATGKDSG